MIKAVRFITGLLVKIETAFLVLFLSVMIILAFAQVVLRNLFDTGILWADPLVRYMVLWSGFVGAALAASQERHISIDALTKFLGPRLRHGVQVLTNLFAAGVCYYLGGAAWRFMVDEKAAETNLVLSIPSWMAILIIPIGYWLLCAHFILNSVDNAAQIAAPPAGEAR